MGDVIVSRATYAVIYLLLIPLTVLILRPAVPQETLNPCWPPVNSPA